MSGRLFGGGGGNRTRSVLYFILKGLNPAFTSFWVMSDDNTQVTFRYPL